MIFSVINSYFFGTILAILVTIICIFFRFPLPLSVSAFFGIINVLEWHWFLALLITLPGLIFLTPSRFKSTFNMNTFKTGYNFPGNSFHKKNTDPLKTNVKNSEIIDGEYKIIDDDDQKK